MNILIAPLDWGLGHATRCIPVIEALRARGVNVWMGGSGASLQLLRRHFPDLPLLELPAYDVHYSVQDSQVLAIAKQIPRLTGVIREEHEVLKRAIADRGIQCCISDNRYGLWSKEIPTIFMCHQLSLQFDGILRHLSPFINRLHHHFISRFDRLWIPDFPGPINIGGALCHGVSLPIPADYVGTLSRFAALQPSSEFAEKRLTPQNLEVLAVLSGPEPQRSILEARISTQAKRLGKRIWILQGNPHIPFSWRQEENITYLSHLPAQELALALKSASWILSRPGYSSLMDYYALELKNVALVPTPGQTEQEYLAHRLRDQGIAFSKPQPEFILEEALNSSLHYQGFTKTKTPDLLTPSIDNLLNHLRLSYPAVH